MALTSFITGLAGEAWSAQGVHSTRGVMDVATLIEEFVVNHYEEHFPGGQVDAALAALIECALRGTSPLGPVLRSWGAPAAVIKHAQRSVSRASRPSAVRRQKK